jgi:phospholipid/cholesterol/gamma-HCH transport system substrate-binding protein
VRFGIFESTGGVGGNLHFLRDSLSINFDLFDFGALDKDYPRLKVYANYAFLGHLFVTVGIDDVLNPQRYDTDVLSPAAQGLSNHALLSGRDVFVGAGISFTDDDLKAIITSVPLPGL